MKDIKINDFQLNILLNKDNKADYDLMLNNVYCPTCKTMCEEGIKIEENYLTSINDIMVKGTCNKCKGTVVRIIEFGEDKDFNKRAKEFRKAVS